MTFWVHVEAPGLVSITSLGKTAQARERDTSGTWGSAPATIREVREVRR